ncbi:uncharacterized protein LOC134449807 [Engraulis encrasicolus]|uniref:uncharacterized protein LOC134449807 n=1 Tax=Engraulis encrasicolus TaxID=184585 RepID=UPI002FD69774
MFEALHSPSDSKCTCSCDIQSDGNSTFAYSIPDYCEGDILIQGIISGEVGLHGSKEKPIPPVTAVSTESFTINHDTSLTPPPVELELHCTQPNSGTTTTIPIHCTWDACINSAKNHSPMVEPPTAEHSLPRTPDSSPHYRVGLVVSATGVVVIVLIWIAVHRRNSMEKKKEDVECPLRESSSETSSSSSSQQLPGPQDPTPITGHDDHGGT